MKIPLSSKQRFRQFLKIGPPDPSAGRLGAAAAAAGSNGKPAKPADKAKRKTYLRQYANWLWPYRWALTAIFVLAVISTGLDMVWPLFIKRVIDFLGKAGAISDKARQLNWMGFSIVSILLIKQAIELLRTWRIAVINARVVFRLRKRLFNRLLDLPLTELS